jgi:PmbA protein
VTDQHPRSDPVERLHRTAAATRDLVVHAAASRWEVYAKASTVREVVFEPDPPVRHARVAETGVAVRTTGDGGAGFGAASGLEADAARVAVEATHACQSRLGFDPLPPARLLGTTDVGAPRALPPSGWAAHIAEELTRGVVRATDRRHIIRRLRLYEASYAWLLATGEGFVATHRDTMVSFLVELARRDDGSAAQQEWLWVRDPATFDPHAAAAAMCDRAVLTTSAVSTRGGLADTLLHPEVAAHVLAALSPLFLPWPAGEDPLVGLLDREGRLATSALTIVDDGSAPDCPAVTPCDGEGMPSRRHLLLDQGVPRHKLASHFEARLYGEPTRGGARRLSYRDYPTTAVTALRAVPDPGLDGPALLEAAGRCVYLLRLLAPVVVDLEGDAYRLLASGVWLGDKGVEGCQPVVEVRGALSHLLRRIEALGKDLNWHQTAAGFVAAPSMLVRCQRVVG